MGDMIVIAVLAVVIGLALRSMWKDHKNGGGCSGCSGNCSTCSHKKK